MKESRLGEWAESAKTPTTKEAAMPAAHSPDAYSFVILGGAGGIGSAVAERLVARGWNVTIAGRTAAIAS